jgi:hypothetical protein
MTDDDQVSQQVAGRPRPGLRQLQRDRRPAVTTLGAAASGYRHWHPDPAWTRPPADVTVPAGVFGALTTLGLFCYELHGIEKCHHFITQGRALEGKLVPGSFIDRPRRVLGFVDELLAAAIIYPASLVAGEDSVWKCVSASSVEVDDGMEADQVTPFAFSWSPEGARGLRGRYDRLPPSCWLPGDQGFVALVRDSARTRMHGMSTGPQPV